MGHVDLPGVRAERLVMAAYDGLAVEPIYLMATALAGEPIPPGALSGALTRNIS